MVTHDRTGAGLLDALVAVAGFRRGSLRGQCGPKALRFHRCSRTPHRRLSALPRGQRQGASNQKPGVDQGFADQPLCRGSDRARSSVRLRALRLHFHAAHPFLGRGRARHGTFFRTVGSVDSQQRCSQCGCLLPRAGTDVGHLVLRLPATSAPRRRPPAPADPSHRHRRVVAEKKHRQFVAVIVDHDNRCVLEVLANREKATVLAYLKKAKEEGLLALVEEVTTDMWDAYVEAAREAFGNEVVITIDRFHVMKNFQECLTGARRELQRKLSEGERERLKGSRWLWATNPENLTPEKRQERAVLAQQFPELGKLADQRESLRALFNDASIRYPAEGRKRLQAWMEQVKALGLSALNKFCKTLGNWLDKIANYFRSRSSNGRTEGLNHGLRAILWRAYGMTNFENFRLRVLHCFGFGSK